MNRSGRQILGPKADSLRRLADAGLPVPEARFLACDTYRAHALRAGVPALLAASAGEALDARRVEDAIIATPVNDGVLATLEAYWRELGAGPVSVRSSANAEDLAGASFAGQHGTYFVRDAEELAPRVRDCWASLFSERAVSYRERNAVAHDMVEMGVVVQRLVRATAAGVAFTASPVSGADDITVEACLGLGESLVSGKVTPDRFVLSRDGSLRKRDIAPKATELLCGPDGRVGEYDVPTSRRFDPSVTDSTVREVVELACAAERLFDGPIDIEWAFDGSTVWLLQARPITTSAPEAVTQDIWSNVNTGEILPDVITPLTWSIIFGHAEDIFGGMFGALGIRVDAKRLIGLVGGRVYFNLSTVRDSFAALPMVDVDTFLGGMHDFVDLPDLPDAHAPRGGGLRAALSLPPYVLRHPPSRAGAFASTLRESTDRARARLDAGPSLPETYELFEALIARFETFADGLAFMAVSMLGFGLLSGVCRKWLGDATGARANLLVAGRGDVSSAEAGFAIWELASSARDDRQVREALAESGAWAEVRGRLEAMRATAYLARWDAFTAEFGHHRRGELEFHNPTWAERPDYVLGVVRGYLEHAGQHDPVHAYEERSRQADAEAERCRAELGPFRRWVFGRVLRWGRASAGTRENIKSEAVRWLAVIRGVALAVGAHLVRAGVLVDEDDVFFLTWEELAHAVGGERSSDWRALVARRRAEHDYLSTLSPPPVVVGRWDERSEGMRVPEGTETLHGISVSAGTARGRARVFGSASTDQTVRPGEILVAPFTDPGWTPYFVPAAGIVMDMGGMLSHGSIIAREYGLPAVVNVGPATSIIRTGDLIEVDGDRGEVRIVVRASDDVTHRGE